MKISSRPAKRRCSARRAWLGELAELAVDGHEVARAHQVEDQLLLLRAGMAGDVQRRVHAAVHHVGAAARQVVDHAEDGLFVAGDDARAEHHRVALFHGDVLMVIHGHARQRRHGFALSAGNEDGHFVARQSHGILGAQQDAVGNIQQAERVRDLGHRHHASANHRHAAVEFPRQIEDQLDAVDGGTEAGDHHPALGAVENLFHARADGALALGEAGAVGIGGIGEQQQDAALAVFGEGVEIEQLVIGGRGVHLEIAGVNDHSERRGNGQGHGAHDGVRHADELDFEGADLENLFGLDVDEAGLLIEVVLFHTALDQGQGEIGSVDGDSDIGKEIGDGADVVLVAMGEDQGADELLVFLEKTQVGHHQVDAQQLGLGEHHSGIDDDDVIAVADGGHVHAKLAASTQGDYLQLQISHGDSLPTAHHSNVAPAILSPVGFPG